MRAILKSKLDAVYDSLFHPRAAPMHGANLAMSSSLARLFNDARIDLVVDIGAGRGDFGIFLRERVGYAGEIASFESIPTLFASLDQRAQRDQRWRVELAAFGEAGGELPINVIDLQNFRPAHKKLNVATRSVRVSRQSVPLRTLDQVLPVLQRDTGAKHIFLKLDPSMQDGVILKGGDTMIGTLAAVQTTLFTDRQFAGVPHYLGLLTCLQAKHFLPRQFWPTATRVGETTISFDCCLLNTRHH